MSSSHLSSATHMKRKSAYGVLAALVALATFVVGCSSDRKTDRAAAVSSTPALGSGGAADFVALGGWQDPACSTAQPKVAVGISEPIDVAGTSLKDYVDGTQAAVDAFNARGGINGRCFDLKVCDGKGDGPTELGVRPPGDRGPSDGRRARVDVHRERGRRVPALRVGGPTADRRTGDPTGRVELAGQLRVHHGRVRHAVRGHAGAQERRRHEVRHLRSGQRPGRRAGRVRGSARQGARHEPARDRSRSRRRLSSSPSS